MLYFKPIKHSFYILKWFFPLFVAVLFSACLQTQSLVSEPDEDVSRINTPVYAGTFSSYIYYGKNNRIVYNDSVSRISNLIYDSIVHANIKKLPFLPSPFLSDTTYAQELARDFFELIQFAQNNKSIKKFRAGDALSRLCEKYPYQHFLFLIPLGYTRTALHLKQNNELQRPTINAQSLVGQGIALSSVLHANGKRYIYFPRVKRIKAQGSNCYAIIYNKQKSQFTFYRQQYYFIEKVHLMQRKYLKKQTEYLLKEYL